MKVAPIIHTRTYSCDFHSEFRVRPNIFDDSDIQWARKVVLEATSSIDTLQGERWLVADNGNYRIAGVIGFLKNICSKCDLDDEKKTRSKELFTDNKGRSIYAFIGVVIKDSDLEKKVDITYDYLWDKFVDIVGPIWKKTYSEVIKTEFEDYDALYSTNEVKRQSYEIGKRVMYESNTKIDKQLFRYYLCNENKNFSFCSNIRDINTVKASTFNFLTTSLNTIKRIGEENNNINTKHQEDKISDMNKKQTNRESQYHSNTLNSKLQQNDKKKHLKILMGGLIIFVGVILIYVLKKEQ